MMYYDTVLFTSWAVAMRAGWKFHSVSLDNDAWVQREPGELGKIPVFAWSHIAAGSGDRKPVGTCFSVFFLLVNRRRRLHWRKCKHEMLFRRRRSSFGANMDDGMIL